MPRPIMLGVVGDSGAGKTTLTRGLVRILGEAQVTRVAADDYHRYDRRQRAEHGVTPLDPAGNYLDVLEQHLAHLRAGEPILKPIYRHKDGTFLPSRYVRPALVNGAAGVVAFDGERPFAVLAFTVIDDRAVAIDVFNDAELVGRLDIRGISA